MVLLICPSYTFFMCEISYLLCNEKIYIKKYQYSMLAEIASRSGLFFILASATLVSLILLKTFLIFKGCPFILLDRSQFK